MGGELLDSPPAKEKTYTEVFEEHFPFYLSIGMTSHDFWAGDAALVKFYRKAYRLRQEEMNNQAWLQGMYIYDAMSTALHNALRGMAKSPPPHKDYAREPYNIFKKEKSPEEKALEVEKEQEKAALWMEMFVKQNQRARAIEP